MSRVGANSTVGNGYSEIHYECDGMAPIFLQVMGTIIFVVVWPFIVLDMKWFPLGRPAAALLGAAAMVILQVVTQQEVYDIQGDFGNLQTIFLLVGMMMISYYYDREGLLRLVALYIFGNDNKPFKYILWKVCLLSAVLSAFVTNDAACLVITPLIASEFVKQCRNKREFLPVLLGIATSANIGSAATVFGNPQNAFIASAANVALVNFFQALLPAAIFGTMFNIALLYLFFFRTVFGKYDPSEDEETQAIGNARPSHYNIPTTLAEERESLALSYNHSQDPYLSSQIARERDAIYTNTDGSYRRGRHGKRSSPYPNRVPDIRIQDESNRQKGALPESELPDIPEEEEEVNKVKSLKERTIREKLFVGWLLFVTLLVVGLLAVPPPPTVSVEFNLGLVPLCAGILTMLVDTILNKTYAYDAMLKIDWTVILMFMGLFVWLGGFQMTCYPTLSFRKLKPYMNLYKVEGVLLFTVFVIIGSNLFSNVPLVILIVHQIQELCGEEECTGPLPGLLLAWISTVAGNFTLIGSVANLIVAEKARSSANYILSFWNYLKYGLVSTILILFSALPVVYFLAKV